HGQVLQDGLVRVDAQCRFRTLLGLQRDQGELHIAQQRGGVGRDLEGIARNPPQPIDGGRGSEVHLVLLRDLRELGRFLKFREVRQLRWIREVWRFRQLGGGGRMLCRGLRRPRVLVCSRQVRELRQTQLCLRRWGARHGGQARGQSGRGDGGDDRNSGGIAGRGGRACLGGSPIRLLLLLGLPPRGELLLGGICPGQRQGSAHQGQQGAEHEATEVGR